MRALRISFAALLLLANAAAGLDPKNTITQYGHTAWRVRDGYFAGSPVTITQTRDGFLWVGTDAGMIRFDGVRFVPWKPPPGSSLPDERIIALRATRDGSLWIGTANGLARWDGQRLKVYATKGRFSAFAEDRQGSVWAGHTRALGELPPLCRFSGGDFKCFQPPGAQGLRYVGALHEDRRGGLWIGGEGGVCRWQAEKPDCYAIESLAALADKDGVFALGDDAEGNLWAGTGVAGIWRRAAEGWTRDPSLADPGTNSQSMLSDREGGLWVGTVDQGLIRRVQGRTDRFNRADGLTGDEINDICEDREGNVWVATSSGLDRFRDVKVATLTVREGWPGHVMAVTASRDGSLWIAERHALFHLEKSGLSIPGASQGLPGTGPTSLLEDSRGVLWVGVDNGLAWRENGRFFPLRMPDGSAVGVVRAMAEDREGDLWIATTNPSRALARVREGRVVEELSQKQLEGQQVVAIAADPKGGLWIGATQGKLSFYRNGRVEPRGTLKSLSFLALDARGLWVATSRGLSLLRNERLSTLETHNGIPCDDVESLVWGDDGSLWLKAPCGLIRIPAGELNSWVDHPERRVRARLLDAFDGAQAGLSPFTPRVARSQDGRLWFAIGSGGLEVLDPERLKDNAVPPPVRILRVAANRKVYEPDLRLRLPALTRALEIDYTALSLAVPEKVRFRYRLDGADGGWQDAGARREAIYTNLGPGKYRFHVIACNNDGLWNQEGAALDFTILPAFYQTGGFFALCAVAFAGFVGSAYRWRVRQMRASLDQRFEERLAERTRIAQDLHDTLLQGFLSASMQLYVATEELPPDEPARGRLERVQLQMRQVIDEGRAALRGLRSSAASVDDLEASLSRVPGELGLQEAVDFRVVVEGRARPILPIARDEIYRIAREALVNAFQHSGASRIEVEIEYTAKQLRIVVRDDGKGIDSDVLRVGREDHWGLSGMRERAERIGARLQVWSRAGSGTEVELAVPGEVAYAPSSGGRRET